MNKVNTQQAMSGVRLLDHGGLDKLEYRTDLSIPVPKSDEVLIKVTASAVNNTDINTRIGWYSKKVTAQTNSGGERGFDVSVDADASWSGAALQFPRVQGADCCGEIIAVGDNVDFKRLTERVLVRPMQDNPSSTEGYQCITFGSECDGGFAQYAIAKADQVFKVDSNYTDLELASFPCAYSTAENMLHRAQVKAGDIVLITGASGGVGCAAIQLAKRRNATVIAICSQNKAERVSQIGADQVVTREQNVTDVLGEGSVDVVIDLVAGKQWSDLIEVLKRGGRYAVAGAIAGPIVEMDVRTLYLKDLSFFGCTYQPREVFENLIGYIEREEIKPIVAQAFSLKDIRIAQQVFLEKNFIGKIVLNNQD